MTTRTAYEHRFVDPSTSLGELLFGLIMTLTFTLGAGIIIEDEGREGARQLLIAFIGCNIAWGLIDAVFYLMGSLAEKNRGLKAAWTVRKATEPKQAYRAILGALPGLAFAIVIFFMARLVIRFAGTFFDRVESGSLELSWLDRDTARPTRRIASFVVWLFALAMAYPYLPGAQTEAFKGLSVLVGLMVSLGGASVIGQAFSGLILMYARIFRRGDYVRIGDNEGTVTELGMFATRIRTGLGEEVSISNASVLAATTKNYSRTVPGAGFVIDTIVTIGYATPWRQVEAMLKEAALRTEDIAREPRPMVRKTALHDYYVEYRLIAYSPAERPVVRAEVLHQLHGHIQDVFNEHGVQIMSPHYMMDPPQPQIVPKDKWFTPPAAAPSCTDGSGSSARPEPAPARRSGRRTSRRCRRPCPPSPRDRG